MENCKQILIGRGKTPKIRDERIDSVKYWLIILVIAGHVLEGDFLNNYDCKVIKYWIYMFHMPLFVFFSGYFSNKKTVDYLCRSIWKLLEPLLLFQTIALLFFYNDSISFGKILTPWWGLWYLLSLIYWRLMLQIIPDRILNNTKLILIVTFCISFIAGFFPFGRLLTIQRTLSFMPFFFLGHCMKGKKIHLPKNYRPFSFIFLIMTLLLSLYFSKYIACPLHAAPYNNINEAFIRMFILGLSIPTSLAFMNICPTTQWSLKQGRLTMQYYIYHLFLIMLFRLIADKYNIQSTLFTAIVFTIAITIVIGFASKLPFFSKFTNPSSLIINRVVGKSS